MSHVPPLDSMQAAIRHAVCPQCFRCPDQTRQVQGSGLPRRCEGDCPIFRNLPQLREIAGRAHEGYLYPYLPAIRDLVCQNCEAPLSVDGVCNDRIARACPLNQYLQQVVQALDALPRVQLT